MVIRCKDVMDRLCSVVESPDPTDPEHEYLSQLRAHAETCERCQDECDEMQVFRSLVHAATTTHPTEKDLQVVGRVASARIRREFSELTGESPIVN